MKSYISTVLLALLALSDVSGQDIKIGVSANREQLYLGESINLTVKVSGSSSPPEPDLSEIKNCQTRLLGSNSENRHSIVFVNGRMTQESFVGRTFTYEVTPQSAGKFVAGPVRLHVNGKTLSQDGPTIQVDGIDKQDGVLINVQSSRESVLVDEPFEVRLLIYIKRLRGQYADADPMDRNNSPQINAAFLENQPITGLDLPNMNEFLQKHVTRGNSGPGFFINEHTINTSPFGMPFGFMPFEQRERARFMFDRRTVETNGNLYLEYSCSLRYTPREEGSYTFGPVTLKGAYATDVDQNGMGVMKSVFAVGPACTVRVVPPPEAGRPQSYIGAIGTNMAVQAELDTLTCNVGDPMKLTLTVSGALSFDNMYAPVLSDQNELTRNFRVYDDTVQMEKTGTSRRFIYTIRSVREGTIELPPIEVAYYDSANRRYQVARSKPIPVRANKAAIVGSEDILSTATNRLEREKAKVSEMFIPAPLNVDEAGSNDVSLLGGSWQFVPVAGGPLLYLLTVGVLSLRRRTILTATARRKKGALKRAQAALTDAGTVAATDQAAARRQICAAVREYVGDRFGVAPGAVTPQDARAILLSHSVDTATADGVASLLEQNFNAGFDVSLTDAGDAAADCGTFNKLLAEVDRSCGRGGAADA